MSRHLSRKLIFQYALSLSPHLASSRENRHYMKDFALTSGHLHRYQNIHHHSWTDPFHALETLSLDGCASLSGVFILPASFKEIYIHRCGNIQVLSWQLHGLQTLQVTASTTVSLMVRKCDSLSLVLNLPMSLKKLDIRCCNRLKSLESHSGDFSSLEELKIRCCLTLASLPDGPRGPQYTSLRWLEIRYCPGIETLPRWVWQQLGSLQEKDLDACYEGTFQILLATF
jgi:hypothetical protein